MLEVITNHALVPRTSVSTAQQQGGGRALQMRLVLEVVINSPCFINYEYAISLIRYHKQKSVGSHT